MNNITDAIKEGLSRGITKRLTPNAMVLEIETHVRDFCAQKFRHSDIAIHDSYLELFDKIFIIKERGEK